MDEYLGTKRIKAAAMTREAYNKYRGWDLPKDEEGSDEGFLVEYLDGGKSNHVNHNGYISWSPKEVFEKAYRPISVGGMSFSMALEMIKIGARVSRQGWNGKDMFVFLVNGSTFAVNREPLMSIFGEGTQIDYHGHIDMRTVDGTIVPWVASQADLLTDDWFEV